MSISSLQSYPPISYDQTRTLLQHNKLDTSSAINPNDVTHDKFLEGFHINTDNIDLSLPAKKSNGITLNLLDDSPNIINSSNFESFLNDMQGLSKDQISQLQSALSAASQTMNNSQTVGGTYGMRISQTNLEFKYISKNLIPEQYQQQFNSFVDNYTNQLSTNYVNLLKGFADQLANTTDPVLIKTGWKDKGTTMQDDLENGSYSFQTSENQYQSLFNSVSVTNPDTLKDQLDSVYKNILSNYKPDSDGASRSDLVNEIKYLSNSWNTFMDAVGDQKNKLTTSVDFHA
ncbi:hypothetical protein DEAC_c26650 [Desulfosporosinus acididurans]|uniref:Uncharacterized protein n=1 Tax=Desulfosporosinus acididurans TaxID=476652 RepID=A0A0J1FRC7_9FIRM|nr:hypothetical protein [Desulfosporosinus acididurans]KLU65528.1 hypothetical protein DEAC_c26650 [Desulfosporosinus acididurans]